jgi:hypothetical protein
VSQARTALMRLQSFGGGLNDTDPPHRIGDDQLSVATDVCLCNSGGINRRDGVARASAQPASLDFRMMHRHTPSQLLSATELWAFPYSASNFYRSTTGTTWTAASLSDVGTASEFTVTDAVSFNGKMYVAYKKTASTDRLNVWDGSTVRRVGISTPSAPTCADTGAGSYAATVRYYKVQFMRSFGSDGKRVYSDLSTALTFTPSGAGTHARVTKPATPDGATHWLLYGSSDNVSYYIINSAVVATTTYDDNTAPSAYAAIDPSVAAPESGAFTPPWSAKYLLVDENRLLIAGAFENVLYANRIGWSSIIGTGSAAYGLTLTQDDERFQPDNYLDLDADEGGEITGMELLNGSVYVFKRYATYKLVRTGNVDVPYKPVTISKVVGAISRKSIVPGEDEAGNPCLYFLSERGPYRLGPGGLQYLGQDIETTWALVNIRPTNAAAHGVYFASSGRVIWWVPRTDYTGAGAYPNCRLTFHVDQGRANGAGRVVGGWTSSASTTKPNNAACSVAWPSSLVSRDSALVPYAIHYNSANSYPPVVWKVFGGQVSDDIVDTTTGAIAGSEAFSPVATTKMFELGLGQNNGVRDVYVACTPAPGGGVAISATLSRDFGAETRTASRTYTGTTTRMPLQISDLTMAGAQFVGLSLTSSTQAAFTIDDVALRIAREEPV